MYDPPSIWVRLLTSIRATQHISLSDLLKIDSTYKLQIELRKSIIASHAELVLNANSVVRPVVLEVYEWLLSIYLPTRFVLMFKIFNLKSGDDTTKPNLLHNFVTDEKCPLEASQCTIEALKIVGELVNEDMLFMLPSSDGDGYSLQGYVNCFANDPSTRRRLARKLRDIHGSIPGYKEKLERNVDK